LLAGGNAAKEGLEGFIQSVQDILQDLSVDVVKLGPNPFDLGELCGLPGEVDGDVTFLPGIAAFLQASIVQFATAPQDDLQRPFLLRRWHQLILERFADCLDHTYLARFRWEAMYCWIAQSSSPFRERACSRANRFIASAASGDTRRVILMSSRRLSMTLL
jgi:hypothetical protein